MTRRRLEIGTVLAASMMLLLFAAYVLLQPVTSAQTAAAPTLPPSPLQQRQVQIDVTRAAFLGDAFTGESTGSVREGGWPALLSAKRGWRGTTYAAEGAGYSTGPSGQTLGKRVTSVAAGRPDVVVVWAAAGERDPARLEKSASSTYTELRKRLPDAKIVVIGPVWWLPGSAMAQFGELRDVERSAAKTANMAFLDPIAERWFSGDNVRFLARDYRQPTEAGQQHVADLLDKRLRELGI